MFDIRHFRLKMCWKLKQVSSMEYMGDDQHGIIYSAICNIDDDD